MPDTHGATNGRRRRVAGKWGWTLVAASVLAAIPLVCLVFADYAAVSPWGSDALLWFSLLFVLPLLPAAVVLVAASVAACLGKARGIALVFLVLAVAYIIGFVGGARIGREVRMRGFARLAERSETLVTAIKTYEARLGRPPDSLDSLVPEFIAAIPSTGMRAYPRYEYAVGVEAEQFDDNAWVLYVSTPSGGINFDQFMYFPKQNYPEYGYGGWLERVGDWAYVHE